LRRGGRSGEDGFGLCKAGTEEEGAVGVEHADFQLEAAADVRGLGAVGSVGADFLPVFFGGVGGEIIEGGGRGGFVFAVLQGVGGGILEAISAAAAGAATASHLLVDPLVALPGVLETLQGAKDAVMPRQPQLGTHHALYQKRATLPRELTPLDWTKRLGAWTRRIRTDGPLRASEPAEAVVEPLLVSLLALLPLLVEDGVRVDQAAFHGSIQPHVQHPGA